MKPNFKSDLYQVIEYNSKYLNQIFELWEKTDIGNKARGDNKESIELTIQNVGKLFLLVDNDLLIGTSWITTDYRRLYLHHFGILPEYQGKKMSHLLLKHSLDWAKDTGMQIKLEVHKENIKALNLYKSYNFKYLGDYDIYIIRSYN